ncbi:MAG TPA: acyl-CoA dehydrogenase family protein [Solirubrobacterales bacterium]|jgi:alkylation response protein AidB-like acyl-CoA dehydrogenase
MSAVPASPPAGLDEFRDYVVRWLSAQEIPGVAEDLDTRFAELRRWQGQLYEAGLIAIAWPREWGGQGLTVHHQLAFVEELTAFRAPQPIGLIGLDVVGPSIARYAAPQLRERLLGPLLSGEDIWCQGFSEPGAGSDLAALRTKAVREGDELVVSGQKTWTSWAHKADRCALLARTDADAERHRGIGYLVVDMDSPGVSVRPIEQMTGESEFGEVYFDEVRVPVGNLLGEPDQGWQIALDTLGHERGSFTIRRRVEISAPFDDAVAALAAWAERERAEVPDAICEAIGASRVALRALQAQTWATLRRIAEGDAPSALDSVDKLVLSEVEQTVFGALKDAVGPLVTVPDATAAGLEAGPTARNYMYGRAGSIYGGTAQIQRSIVGERLLGLPRP